MSWRPSSADDLVDHYTWVLAGDGCLMEGMSARRPSPWPGISKLNKLIVLWDDNDITIDGAVPRCRRRTDPEARFKAAAGWNVQAVDGHDPRPDREARSAEARKSPTSPR
jgi:transketolase